MAPLIFQKNTEINVKISALASKMDQIKKIKAQIISLLVWKI